MAQLTLRLLRARDTVRRDGLLACMAAAGRRYLVDHHRLRLYEHHHRAWPDGDFRPRLDSFEERFVTSNEEADQLARDHQDFRPLAYAARQGLDRGAVALCIYVGREVAHIAWLAMSERGRSAFIRGPYYEVRFGQGEGWTGAAYTVPAYRGKGLLTYSCYRRFEYLQQHGCMVSRASVELHNTVSHHATMRFEPRIYAIGAYWRVLGMRWWSEHQVDALG